MFDFKAKYIYRIVYENFSSSCKKLLDQARSGRHEYVDSDGVLKVIETNPVNSTLRKSEKLDVS